MKTLCYLPVFLVVLALSNNLALAQGPNLPLLKIDSVVTHNRQLMKLAYSKRVQNANSLAYDSLQNVFGKLREFHGYDYSLNFQDMVSILVYLNNSYTYATTLPPVAAKKYVKELVYILNKDKTRFFWEDAIALYENTNTNQKSIFYKTDAESIQRRNKEINKLRMSVSKVCNINAMMNATLEAYGSRKKTAYFKKFEQVYTYDERLGNQIFYVFVKLTPPELPKGPPATEAHAEPMKTH